MNSTVNIFSIKTVSFEQGERDPFGFDDYARGLGEEYLPFSGTVSKPSYFLFVAYINYILSKKLIDWKTEKQKREIQIRIEKLLVYCWKKSATKEELRGANIIGNSFDLNDIDVFSSKGWVKQNAFKIYTDKSFVPQTLELYLKKIGDRQIQILNRFISVDYKTPKFDKKEFTEKLLKDLQSSEYSLFHNHELESRLKRNFKSELLLKIKGKRKTEYLQYVEPFFKYKKFDPDNFLNKLLGNKRLPFFSLNDWFGKFVSAVDADINNKSNKSLLWTKANEAFRIIEENGFQKISKSDVELTKRQKPTNWFQIKENTYFFSDRGNKSGNRKIENLWESYKKRTGEKNESGQIISIRYFFNYRHYAFARILKELQQ